MPTIKLKGLSASSYYLIEEINLHEKQQPHCQQNGILMSGSDLLNRGIRLNLVEEYDSAVLTFTEQAYE